MLMGAMNRTVAQCLSNGDKLGMAGGIPLAYDFHQ